MKIYIIILHYGKVEVTKNCIASLFEHDKQFEQIVLINNDEKIHGSSSMFAFPKNKIHVINNKKNVGFAAGVNIGIRYALKEKADFLFLLNNDTIVRKDFLQKLESVLEKNNNIGIIGPAIMFHKNGKNIYDLGGKVNKLFGRTSHVEVEKVTDNTLHIADYISGCCMLIKKELFETIGYFDERFFLYYEDADFCLRAAKAGYQSAVLPTLTIYHELSKAAGRISSFSVYHMTKSGVIFGKKYCKIRVLNIALLFAQSSLFMIKNKKAGIGAFSGLWDGIKI